MIIIDYNTYIVYGGTCTTLVDLGGFNNSGAPPSISKKFKIPAMHDQHTLRSRS